MKQIKIPSTINLIGDANDSELIERKAEVFDQNKLEVLNAFSTIEFYISYLLSYEFLGPYDKKRKEEFEKFNSKIIHTSWFNFNEKRKMTVEILVRDIEDKTEKKKIESIFRKIMDYRNALAHGKFITDGTRSILEFYQGELKEEEFM